MPDIVLGKVTRIFDKRIYFHCHDYSEDRNFRCERPLFFMDDQALYLQIDDVVEFVPHPDTPIQDGSLGRIRNRNVPNRFLNYDCTYPVHDWPDVNDPEIEFKLYQYMALRKTNRPLEILNNSNIDDIDWQREGF
jgi:hypothetical protein